ncbi:hypothetical protein [Marinomonas sp. IMCC 4694]|uniref:hypothetical protein n=1 Tax=Marinomonas sp. IMCC 4694 TaxID=2605432 RepID=UPI0011E826A7|nr:hypothetical protein [Marinomonas sp. IMCC 4694]TYL47697.1 hypothetical protein FXV75_06955 [Marinomonas sp. IMCC 4694]
MKGEVWQHGLIGIGSEWSRPFPGYVAGAIDTANASVNSLGVSRQRSSLWHCSTLHQVTIVITRSIRIIMLESERSYKAER